MDERRLGLLRDLQRRGTVSAVAAAAHLTPTAVSQQLKLLEREAGAALLRRAGRRVELTDAGRVLAEASLEVEAATARLGAAWDRFRGAVAGEVSISVFPTAGQLLLPRLLGRLRAWPELGVRVVEADRHADGYPSLVDEVDLVVGHHASPLAAPALGSRPVSISGSAPESWRGLRITELYVEPLDVALAPDHRLARRRAVTVGDLRDETWISVGAGWPFDAALVRWFAASGAAPRIAHRFADLRLQEALVAAGQGVALLPRFAVDDRDGARLALLPTADLAQARRVVALARADRAERVAVQTVLRELIIAGGSATGAPRGSRVE